MAKKTEIEPALRDELLKDQDPKKVFDSDGLLGDLKQALAQRILAAEMDHHLEQPAELRCSNRSPILVRAFDLRNLFVEAFRFGIYCGYAFLYIFAWPALYLRSPFSRALESLFREHELFPH